MKNRIKKIKSKAEYSRRMTLEICLKAGLGHVTSGFSCAEIVSTLYYDVMNYRIEDPIWENRDRFIMSKNHGSVITYPILADLGFVDSSTLMTFMANGSEFGGHSKFNINGVDYSGGSLGIGLGIACGLSYSAKLHNKDWKTYVIVGDGECYEGSIWESIMFAGHNKLNNLVTIVDRNQLCVTDFTENMLKLEPFEKKWESFGWKVYEVDGHSIEELLNVFDEIEKTDSEKPICIIANTTKGEGIKSISDQPLMHGAVPKGENVKKAFHELEEYKGHDKV